MPTALRPFNPLYSDEEPSDSEVSRNNNPVWMPPAQPIVLRFDGPIRAAVAAGVSPVRIETIQYMGGTPLIAVVNPSLYDVTVKRPGDSGVSNELSILSSAGSSLPTGLLRITLNPQIVNPLLSDCVPPCASTSPPAPPVRPFQHYVMVWEDCGQDGIAGPPDDEDCDCGYYTNCMVADFNQDGGVDGSDPPEFFGAWENAEPRADTNSDGGIDGEDIGQFYCWWTAGGCG